MSDNEKRTKPKYETPLVVPLGGLAQGSGYCEAGSGDTTTYCTAGGINTTACSAGPMASDTTCSAGGAKA
jgi:hypothetical protein